MFRQYTARRQMLHLPKELRREKWFNFMQYTKRPFLQWGGTPSIS
jgi:hypothetical protein